MRKGSTGSTRRHAPLTDWTRCFVETARASQSASNLAFLNSGANDGDEKLGHLEGGFVTIQICVVGLGKIAQDQHLPVAAKNADFNLAAVVSSRGSYGNVKTFKTFSELVASGIKLDAVTLCMPPKPRFDIAHRAIDAGFHLLLERPPTSTIGELEALLAHAAAHKRIVFTAWHSQHNAAVDEAKRLLAGLTVRRLHVSWKEDVRYWHPGQEWIWEPGGFGVFDPGINAFSIISKIMPVPILVADALLMIPSNKATPIAASIRFKSPIGIDTDLTAELDWQQTGEPSWDIDVETNEGTTLQLSNGGTQLRVNGEVTLAGSSSQEYEGIYAHFAELLKSGKSDVDSTPLQLVSDCFMLGRRVDADPFV
ncbi:Gfo/Idh/MocA family oxidoreductase [Mesorhizobium sp. M0012]|uniref:Gfo/Idh/MocA family protein n=1 Tax=Mesorhizobium sp. M0012 TaxID=2956840 RepID=UPI003337772D